MTKLSYDQIADALNEAYRDCGEYIERTGCAIAIEYLSDALFKADPSFDGQRFNARAKSLANIPA